MQAWIRNGGAASYTGIAQFVLVEDSVLSTGAYVYYQNQAMRDMLPNSSGETFTLAASDSVLKTRAFTVASGWPQDSCKVVVFVQNTRANGDTMQQGGDLRVKAMVAVEEEASGNVYPQAINLRLNSPNPFSNSIDIGYTVPLDERVSIKIYNSSGRLVSTLVDAMVTHGYHTHRFDARGLPNGIYLVMLRDKDAALTQKITLIK